MKWPSNDLSSIKIWMRSLLIFSLNHKRNIERKNFTDIYKMKIKPLVLFYFLEYMTNQQWKFIVTCALIKRVFKLYFCTFILKGVNCYFFYSNGETLFVLFKWVVETFVLLPKRWQFLRKWVCHLFTI